MKISKHLLVLLTGLGLLSACQKQASTDDLRKQLSQLHSLAELGDANRAVDAGEKALGLMDMDAISDGETLSSAAEEGFIFDAFDESLRIFEMAYLKDKNNQRANAYLALLPPMKYLKGYIWRSANQELPLSVFGFYVIQTYKSPAPERFLMKFLITPYKTQFHYAKELIDDVLRPFSEELISGLKYFDFLRNQFALDLHLKLPRVMMGLNPIRFRREDAELGFSFDIGLATLARMYTIYDSGESPFGTSTDQSHMQELWNVWSQNPQFGVLTDKLFYSTLKERTLEFAEGTELASEALKARFEHGNNDKDDAIQARSEEFETCEVVKTDTRFYYRNPNTCQRPQKVKSLLSLSPWLGPDRDLSIKDRFVYNNREWEPDPSWMSYEELQTTMESLRKAMQGPHLMEAMCGKIGEKPVLEKYWVDVPTYLLNPVDDLKKLNLKFDDEGIVIGASDPTIHGLFPRGLPCEMGRMTIKKAKQKLNELTHH